MAEHIEVVDINEDKQEEAAESKDDQLPEFNEVTEKALQKEELNAVNDETHADVNEEPKEEVRTETKPKTKAKTAAMALKENTTCPDCGITLTMHGLKYTHKRYCKAKPKVVDIEALPPSPPGLVRQKTAIAEPEMVKIENLHQQTLIPTPEQIAAFLAQERKLKAEKKRARINTLITQAF